MRLNSGTLISAILVLYQFSIGVSDEAAEEHASLSSSHCKSQGPVSIPASARLQPRPSHLLFCKQHSNCTCCNASSSITVQRSVQSWIADQALGSACKASMVTIACRVCDPLIGTGTASGLCPEFCDSLHQACREEFFHYPVHGEFGPCSAEKQPSVVCAKLKEFATNGTQFCAMLGLLADKQGKCFDGTASMLASCSQVRRSMRRSSKGVAARGMTKVYLLLKVLAGLCLLAFFLLNRLRRKSSRMPLVRGLPYGQRAPHQPSSQAR